MTPAERFAGDIAAALGRLPRGDAPLALAVSGGADSMAMLALAAEAFPSAVIAATVDHQLRPGSADEAAMVAGWCAERAIPHATLTPAAPIPRQGLQAGARAARYALLARWAIDGRAAALATAHHADDQAETFLMRAARGSGIAGLRGIPRRRPLEVGEASLPLVRPLLGWRRAELRAIVTAAAIPFVDDPSNLDPAFERVRVRALLADQPWLDAAQIARAAAHLSESDQEIEEMRAWLAEARRVASPPDQRWIDVAGLPRELRRRLARGAIVATRHLAGIARPDFDPAANIEPLLDALERGGAATQAGVLASPHGTVWRFAAAPPRRGH
ncbi:tRNA lysidine(34) synthetase TilS [Sphingomonas sp.]|uniref:tRNA lysidine(34) synthetase TilS n=1 Tax=Sphingomonas sp. TaxID=28214 RepID=UPI002CE75BCE|nr:tRNA lysidine(34) synthetase TilS [Sphingomonas sp.]HWK35983.1 tRNA lysidine(34) synthetase TilS [Sphingomonas sp.]